MSIRVDPDHLAEHADLRPFAYIVTIGPNDPAFRVHVVAATVTVRGANVSCERVGNSTRRNIEANSSVTVVWPPVPNGEAGSYDHYTLIADGWGSVRGDSVDVSIDAAILHRPA